MHEIEPIDCPNKCETVLDLIAVIYNGNTGQTYTYFQCPECKSVFWW
jgi:hypothetical protein